MNTSTENPSTADLASIVRDLAQIVTVKVPAVAPPPPVTVSVAVRLVLENKWQHAMRAKYITSLEHYLGAFARRHGERPISEITVHDLETWFVDRNEALSSRKSNYGRLGALFSFAKRRGWITESPVDRLERVRLEHKPPAILTVNQTQEVMAAVRQHWPRQLAWMTLAIFAGIRPEELQKLTWADVDLERGTVTLSAAVSKIRRRRIVHLMQNAHEWMKLAHQQEAVLPIAEMTRKRMRHRIQVVLQMRVWPQDLLRHTCASYMLAESENPSKVACELGNSISTLLNFYKELVHKEDAEAFWKILP